MAAASGRSTASSRRALDAVLETYVLDLSKVSKVVGEKLELIRRLDEQSLKLQSTIYEASRDIAKEAGVGELKRRCSASSNASSGSPFPSPSASHVPVAGNKSKRGRPSKRKP